MSVKDVGANVNAYLIGNMTLEVKDGYQKNESLEFIYSRFSEQRLVENFTQRLHFSEWKVRKIDWWLVVKIGFGIYFGLMILLRCGWTTKGIFSRYIKRRRERKWIPVLIRKRKLKKE